MGIAPRMILILKWGPQATSSITQLMETLTRLLTLSIPGSMQDIQLAVFEKIEFKQSGTRLTMALPDSFGLLKFQFEKHN